ncbi:uncharacterized protein PAC_08710 [Phialocephala subalpina]|uniref:Heme haloperoxidase family profile domain-containing protein n=1 Tax=Phialocephala subalpina TaxID=576137 RepID=A0A1L7X1B8_9HELO|nr:uncharacterized protein PAC_08710 [Phialocephala subalpina]
MGLVSFITGLFGFGSSTEVVDSRANKGDVTASAPDDHLDHAYIRGNIENHGPCPGLNSLANQGWINRDGKNITPVQVETALKNILHMSSPLASSLANMLKQVTRADGTFDLVDVRKHNVLEHDASFTRHDAIQGDNFTFQPALFEALLKDAEGGPLTIKSLAKTFRRRHQESRAAGSPPMSIRLWFIHLGEAVALFHAAQGGNELPLDVVRTFYLEERFPEMILKNKNTRTMLGLTRDVVALWFRVVFKF